VCIEAPPWKITARVLNADNVAGSVFVSKRGLLEAGMGEGVCQLTPLFDLEACVGSQRPAVVGYSPLYTLYIPRYIHVEVPTFYQL